MNQEDQVKTVDMLFAIAVQEEKVRLESGEVVLPKVFAIGEDGHWSMVVIAGDFSDDKPKVMQAIGVQLKKAVDDMRVVLLVSDTYMAAFRMDEDIKHLSLKEASIRHAIMNGRVSLHNIPPEFHHLRSEALVMIGHDGNKIVRFEVRPYTRVGKIVAFKEDISKDQSMSVGEDNLLRYVWEGYRA